MTSLTLPLPPTLISTPARTVKPQLALSSLRQSHPFPRFSHYRLPKPPPPKTITASFAYVSGPASDPIVSEPDPKIDEPDSKGQSPSVISWGLLLSLLLKHKLRLAISAFALIGCSACTLSMPIFSGTNRTRAREREREFHFKFSCFLYVLFGWREKMNVKNGKKSMYLTCFLFRAVFRSTHWEEARAIVETAE